MREVTKKPETTLGVPCERVEPHRAATLDSLMITDRRDALRRVIELAMRGSVPFAAAALVAFATSCPATLEAVDMPAGVSWLPTLPSRWISSNSSAVRVAASFVFSRFT